MTSAKRLLAALGALALTVLVPGLVHACPVCFSATDENVVRAYLIGALFLSAMPIGMIGSVVTWVYFKKRRIRLAAQGREDGASAGSVSSYPERFVESPEASRESDFRSSMS